MPTARAPPVPGGDTQLEFPLRETRDSEATRDPPSPTATPAPAALAAFPVKFVKVTATLPPPSTWIPPPNCATLSSKEQPEKDTAPRAVPASLRSLRIRAAPPLVATLPRKRAAETARESVEATKTAPP